MKHICMLRSEDQSVSIRVGPLLLMIFLLALASLGQAPIVHIGAEVLLEEQMHLLAGKRVGVICNQTSILPNGTHIIDTLLARGVAIRKLFGPEHGIRGTKPAGAVVEHGTDVRTGIPIISLYGTIKKPSAEMLEDIDLLLFDIQDVGARFYTYYITMSDAMEAAAVHRKAFVVLDRPNPINGIDIEGPILDSGLQSGVGRFPLPIRHGLTLGELALMIAGEKWIQSDFPLLLKVVPMKNWNREMWYDQTGLKWVPPSPNMKSLATATVYPGTCLFEATNLSEGRGTLKPFEYLGAPWLRNREVARKFNRLKLPGVKIHPVSFQPRPDSATGLAPKYSEEMCSGLYLQITDRDIFRPVSASIHLLAVLRSIHPTEFKLGPRQFDKLSGSTGQRTRLEAGESATALSYEWAISTVEFRKLRAKYLLY